MRLIENQSNYNGIEIEWSLSQFWRPQLIGIAIDWKSIGSLQSNWEPWNRLLGIVDGSDPDLTLHNLDGTAHAIPLAVWAKFTNWEMTMNLLYSTRKAIMRWLPDTEFLKLKQVKESAPAIRNGSTMNKETLQSRIYLWIQPAGLAKILDGTSL